MDPLSYALSMMRGDADYDLMQQTGGPTQEAADQLMQMDARNHVALVEGQAQSNPNVMALLDRVNDDYAQAQRDQHALDQMHGYAAHFGMDEFDQGHAEQQYALYMNDDGSQPDWIKRQMYGIPTPPSHFQPESFSPLDAYVQATYPDRPEVHDVTRIAIEKGTHDFANPAQSFMSSHDPSWRERATGWLVDNTSLSFPEAGAVTGNNSLGVGVADFTPAAIPLIYDDVQTAMQHGNTGEALMTGGIGAVTAFPAVKAMTKGGGLMLRKATERWQ